MKHSKDHAPPFPTDVDIGFHDGPLGRMRSRSVGRARPDTPEVVVVQGMSVADYLMPGLGALGAWTRAHLVELPGFAGSGEPPHELDVPEFGQCVADWIRAQCLEPVILAGHSSGTQVAARAAVGHPAVAGVVLAGPTVDPSARGLLRILIRWRLNGRYEPPGLSELHIPEWKRAGARRLLHLVLVHLADPLEEQVRQLRVPSLVIRGEQDRISTEAWARQLAKMGPGGGYVEVPGAHSFPWLDSESWSAPVRRLAIDAGRPR